MDLKTFLLARTEEDEREANEHLGAEYYQDGLWPEECAARVLAECAAKRAIIGPAAQEVVTQWQIGGRIHESAIPAEQMERWSDGTGPSMDTLRALAAVYADHPDYRQEWAA